ncbi:hypothetical protein DL769_002535 [Monosporascus sp. CRB-8-3]|nr:hypothetical protein DL769_002535 [Monosporascus sp. CRB-8-3]
MPQQKPLQQLDMEPAPLIPAEPPTPTELDAFLKNRKQRLLSLPAEMRFMIYEHAVMEHLPIYPMQVAEGSNKFIWGRCRKVRENGREGGSALEPAGKAPTVTQLARTSRQIYLDLAADPLFYRSNTFSFRDPNQLHFFLAALTPSRDSRYPLAGSSAFSQQLRVGGDPVRLRPRGGPLTVTAVHANVMWTSAPWRRIASWAGPANTAAETSAILRAVPPRARSAILLGLPALWDMPGFPIVLDAGTFAEVVVKLGDEAPDEALPRRFREGGDFIKALREAKTAFRARRERNPLTRPTDWEVYNATRGAGLDFPGDIRMNQKGTPPGFETMPKYDTEGVLAWRVCRVRDVRRKGPGAVIGHVLECLVEFPDQGLSWEEFRHLAS